MVNFLGVIYDYTPGIQELEKEFILSEVIAARRSKEEPEAAAQMQPSSQEKISFERISAIGCHSTSGAYRSPNSTTAANAFIAESQKRVTSSFPQKPVSIRRE